MPDEAVAHHVGTGEVAEGHVLDVGEEAVKAGAREFRSELEAKLRKEFLAEDVKIVESVQAAAEGA